MYSAFLSPRSFYLISHTFHMKMNWGAAVLTWKLDIISTCPLYLAFTPWVYASVYGGSWKKSNIFHVKVRARVGVLIRRCGQGLRVRSSWSVLVCFMPCECPGFFFFGRGTQVQGRGSCPQGRGSHNKVQACWWLDRHPHSERPSQNHHHHHQASDSSVFVSRVASSQNSAVAMMGANTKCAVWAQPAQGGTLAAALHHSRDEGCETYDGLQAQKTASSGGMRPAPLSEVAGLHGAAVTVGYVAAGTPLQVVPTLRGDDDVDGTTVTCVRLFALAEKKEKEEKGERAGSVHFSSRRFQRPLRRPLRQRGRGRRGGRNVFLAQRLFPGESTATGRRRG